MLLYYCKFNFLNKTSEDKNIQCCSSTNYLSVPSLHGAQLFVTCDWMCTEIIIVYIQSHSFRAMIGYRIISHGQKVWLTWLDLNNVKAKIKLNTKKIGNTALKGNWNRTITLRASLSWCLMLFSSAFHLKLLWFFCCHLNITLSGAEDNSDSSRVFFSAFFKHRSSAGVHKKEIL